MHTHMNSQQHLAPLDLPPRKDICRPRRLRLAPTNRRTRLRPPNRPSSPPPPRIHRFPIILLLHNKTHHKATHPLLPPRPLPQPHGPLLHTPTPNPLPIPPLSLQTPHNTLPTRPPRNRKRPRLRPRSLGRNDRVPPHSHPTPKPRPQIRRRRNESRR